MTTAKAILATFAFALAVPGRARSSPSGREEATTLAVGGKTALYICADDLRAARLLQRAGPRTSHQHFPRRRASLQRWSRLGRCRHRAYEHTIRMQAKGQDIKA